MKKFYSLLVAAAMVLGATSCQQEAIEEVATNEPVSFTATLNSTRTELGEGNKVMVECRRQDYDLHAGEHGRCRIRW